MRQVIDVPILTIARLGSFDSAAATVVISEPVMEKNTVATAANTGVQPFGAKPPCTVRLPMVGPAGEVKPKAQAAATTMKARMAPTLTDENQNSNSPYDRADSRFTAVITAISTRPISQIGSAIHCWISLAPAIASIGTTITQKYQYSHPATNPAPCPSPWRANSVKDRMPGCATAISPSMRMIR